MRKVSRGRGFRGVLTYGIERDNKRKGLVLGGNLDGNLSGKLAAQFAASCRLRPDIEKPVWHQALRLPVGETISNERWVEIANDYMRRMIFTELHPRVYILHDDEAGQHIHIVASRIAFDGRIFLGQNENLKSTAIVRQLEKDYGLKITQECKRSQQPGSRKPSPKEASAAEVAGVFPPRVRLQKLVDMALGQTFSASHFVAYLEAKGAGVRANIASTGKLYGLSFRIDGVNFKGSDLGKAYTLKGFAERGLSYDYVRDGGALRAASERAERGIPPKPPTVLHDTNYVDWKAKRTEGNRKVYLDILARRAQALKEIRERGGAERKGIHAAHAGRTAAEDRAAKALELSKQRLAEVLAEANVRDIATKAIENYKRDRLPIGYRYYLADLAQTGSVKALEQLRRMPITNDERPVVGNQIDTRPGLSAQPITTLLTQEWMVNKGIDSAVDHVTTAVSYYRKGQLLFIDQRHAIVTNREDRETLELQLALAVKKFGGVALRLDGSEQYIGQTIRLAAEDRRFAAVAFDNPEHQARMEKHRNIRASAVAKLKSGVPPSENNRSSKGVGYK